MYCFSHFSSRETPAYYHSSIQNESKTEFHTNYKVEETRNTKIKKIKIKKIDRIIEGCRGGVWVGGSIYIAINIFCLLKSKFYLQFYFLHNHTIPPYTHTFFNS